ncbi:MAG: hypothetical protein KF891_03120 [Rhizobacter sp.]|nr:hypothetical protein [Rhizobacter sp.]
MIPGLRLTHNATPKAGLTPGLGHRIARFFRWALVLLLVADIVGSPLHRHHHDSGIDGSALHAQRAEPRHTELHAEDGPHELHFIHAVTTVRVESHGARPDANADVDHLFVALVSTWAAPWPNPAPITRLSWIDLGTTLHPLHRSLPPAGRAPPPRA